MRQLTKLLSGVILAGFLLGGCKAKLGEQCTERKCGAGLKCIDKGTWVCVTPAEALHSKETKLCLKTCHISGECAYREGGCYAQSDADCAKSELCSSHGKCAARDGKCVAGSDRDCLAATICKQSKLCSAHLSGECGKSAAYCKASSECRELGHCSPSRIACVAASDADCRQSEPCRHNGKCTHRSGECVVGGESDCVQSTGCGSYRACRFELEQCRPDAQSCSKSAACSVHGRCTGDNPAPTTPYLGNCRATKDADCRRSKACASDGRCVVRSQQCAKSCRDTEACRMEGRCTDGPNKSCVAKTEADCKASVWCAQKDQCRLQDAVCAS